MGVPDFSGVFVLAIVRLFSLLLVVFPAIGALGWLIFSRLVWGEWLIQYAWIGVGIGFIPALLVGYMWAEAWWKHRND